MKILLISANKEMLPDPVAPLGLAYIAAVLLAHHHQVEIVDLCFADDEEKVLTHKLKEFMPDIIGISIRNIDNVSFPHTSSYLDFYKDVVSWCRSTTTVPIVGGGSGFTLLPFEILQFLNLDYGIIGEGEEKFFTLVSELSNNQGNIEIPGVISPHASHQESSPPRFLELDTLPLPQRELLDNKAYLQRGGMGNIQTKRGCAFNCIYCTYPLIEGRKVRLRSPSKVVTEIEDMKYTQGIDTFFIVDNVFNYPPSHAQEICQELIKRKLEVRWSCYCNPAFITLELIGLMRDAGCTGIEFGTDSCENSILKRLRKNFTLGEIQNASLICRQRGISFCHNLLLGAPGENRYTVSETLRVMEAIDPTAVIIMIGIRIFPHTELAAIAERENILTKEEQFITPLFYIAPRVSSFIIDTVQEYAQSHTNCIVPGKNIMHDLHIQKKLRRYGIKGPLWEHLGIRKHREKRKSNEGIYH